MIEGSYFMYFDDQKHASVNRANDEFLRRMIGGELKGEELLRLHSEVLDVPMEQGGRRVDCRGNVYGAEAALGERIQERGTGCDCGDCPTEISAPALAMVYAPKQCWRGLLDPQTGLSHGSMFTELILPFEGCPKSGRMEVKACK